MSDPIERLRAGAWYLGSPGSVVPFELAKQIITGLQDQLKANDEAWQVELDIAEAKQGTINYDALLTSCKAAEAEVDRLRGALSDVIAFCDKERGDMRPSNIARAALAPVEKEDGDDD